MALPFISTTDLDNYLGRTIDPDKGAIAVDSACDLLCKVSAQSLYFVADDVVALDSDGTEILLLPEMPVYSVSSVSQRVDEDPLNDIVLVDRYDYWFDEEEGAIVTSKIGSKFLPGRQLYSVTYSHGYVSDSAGPGLPANVQEWPSALRMLALQVASRIYDQQLVQQETVGSYVSIYSAREAPVLTDRERSLLARIVDVGRRR